MFGKSARIKEFNPQEYYGVDGANLVFHDSDQVAGTCTFEYIIDNPTDRTQIVAEILKKIGRMGNVTFDPAVTDPKRVVIYFTPPRMNSGL